MSAGLDYNDLKVMQVSASAVQLRSKDPDVKVLASIINMLLNEQIEELESY